MDPTLAVEVTTANRYVVVLRCQSSVRLRPNEGQLLHFQDMHGLHGPVEVRIRTRWVDEGHKASMPRELWLEIRCRSESLDAAAAASTSLSRFVASLLAFTANVSCGPPEVHLAYNSTPGLDEREFLEVFLPDERGFPREGRILETAEFSAVFQGFMGAGDAARRMSRALNQYELALRHWYLGGEYLALSHLYMAVEALTPLVIQRQCTESRIGLEELARQRGLDPERPRWRPALDSWARLHLIFSGDSATYQAAKKASDGVEHGFLEMNDVIKYALKATSRTFEYVRHTMLRLIDLDEAEYALLYARPPRDVQSLRKMVRGRFVGAVDDIAPPGEEYPYLEWKSDVAAATWVGDRLNITFTENVTVRCHPDVAFRGTSFEARGRLEEGYESITIERESVIEQGPGETVRGAQTPELEALLAVADFAATIVRNLGERGVSQVERLSLFRMSMQLAALEAIVVLVRDSRTAEALALLPGLIRNTCLLQLIAQPTGGPRVAIKAALEALDRSSLSVAAEDSDTLDRRRESLWRLAEEGNMGLPSEPLDVRSAPFMQQAGVEAAFVEEIALFDELAIAQHLEIQGEAFAFRTQVDNRPLTAGAAALAVQAVVSSAVALTQICQHDYDSEAVRALVDMASRLGAVG